MFTAEQKKYYSGIMLDEDNIHTILGMDPIRFLIQLIHELPKVGTHWYVFSDNIYGYDGQTGFWCSLDGVKMEASVKE